MDPRKLPFSFVFSRMTGRERQKEKQKDEKGEKKREKKEDWKKKLRCWRFSEEKKKKKKGKDETRNDFILLAHLPHSTIVSSSLSSTPTHVLLPCLLFFPQRKAH